MRGGFPEVEKYDITIATLPSHISEILSAV